MRLSRRIGALALGSALLISGVRPEAGAARGLQAADSVREREVADILRAANLLVVNRQWVEADALYSAARNVAAKPPELTELIAGIWEAQATAYRSRTEFPYYDHEARSRAEAGYRHAVRGITGRETLRDAENLRWLARTTIDPQQAWTHFAAALAIQERLAPNSAAAARTRLDWGRLAHDERDEAKASALLEQAVIDFERLAPRSLELARALTERGNLHVRNGNHARASTLLERAHSICAALDATGEDLATILTALGNLAQQQNNFPSAEMRFGQALDIWHRLSPIHLGIVTTSERLVTGLNRRGEYEASERVLRDAVRRLDFVAPHSPVMIDLFIRLGSVAYQRLDFLASERHYRTAYHLAQRRSTASARVAMAGEGLASVLNRRGEYDTAEQLTREALAIMERLTPDSLDVARFHGKLGSLQWGRGNLAAAQPFYDKMLPIVEKVAPGSLEMVDALNGLASLALYVRSDLEAAEHHARRALAVLGQYAPGHRLAAFSLTHLGVIEERRNDLRSAERLYQQALEIRRQVPGSIELADAYTSLARVSRRMGRVDESMHYFEEGLSHLEAQVERLGGVEEVRSGYAARHGEIYRDYVGLLLESNRTEDAFAVIERSRARLFLRMLAERGIAFEADAPAPLAAQRRRLAREYDRAHAQLASLNGISDRDREEAVLSQLRELRGERERIAQQVRASSSRSTALRSTKSFDVSAAQQALDPGTVLLVFTITNDQPYLLVLQSAALVVGGAPRLSVFPVACTLSTLQERVARFRALIERGPSATNLAAVHAEGRSLYELLIQPADALIAKADRVLISPDGPLHTLPFAALVDTASETPRYFIEAKPLHTIISATVYNEVKMRRKAAVGRVDDGSLVAFGDPTYPPLPLGGTPAVADAELREVLRRGFAFDPLPGSRIEVAAIARFYGRRASVYVGPDATEERVKAVAGGARYLHFATHGIMDGRLPLNSALVLSIPDGHTIVGDNGLLQAWEILEQLRIDADLVTLSACDTALGVEQGGEGLMGLTRAFLSAGARSVVASLWSVGDESTARLMTTFYEHLRAGRSKDEALRTAQLQQLRSGRSSPAATVGHQPDDSHPFHWAAFSLSGDWR